MTITRTQLILGALALVGVLVIGFMGGRGCGHGTPVGPDPVQGIDAGPGETEIAARLDAAVQADQARMDAIENKFDDDIAAFDAQQRADYERLRGGDDLEAAARYLSEWNHSRSRDAGT